ncbi:MAG: DNA repair protein RecN [Eubacteriales bacterium]
MTCAFRTALTILTGETGAGKSIIIDSLGLILGARPSRELIRQGEDSAYVSACFIQVDDTLISTLKEYSVEVDEDERLVIIRRELYSDGRSGARINGRTVPVAALKECGRSLVNIHGQHDAQLLLQPENHIRYLDSYASELVPLIEDYSKTYARLKEVRQRISSLSTDEREVQRTVEMLKYQIDDISAARLKAGEEEKLEGEKLRLSNIEKIGKSLTAASAALNGSDRTPSAVELLRRAVSALTPIAGIIEGGEELVSRLEACAYELRDIVDSLPSASEEENPAARLDKIESRLELISRLKRKYGGSVEEVLDFCEKCKEKLDNLAFSERDKATAEKQHSEILAETGVLAETLTSARKSAAQRLRDKISENLAWLDMQKVVFEVSVVPDTDGDMPRYSPSGADRVEFLIATNPGEDPKPLSKIASGGELSRIMLALKSVLAMGDKVGTLIFDEVDIGISGRTSEKVGVLLEQLARDVQVLCVTHSAQIAAKAREHIKISKQVEDGRAQTRLSLLDYEGRVEELSRIMGGITVTDTVRRTAREMLGEQLGVRS